MAEYIDSYMEASGAKPEVKEKFQRLNSGIPILSTNSTEAGKELKDVLLNRQGFHYIDGCFTLQDVLRLNGGNCSGMPLLAGTILGERGYNPVFRLGTNPKDYSFTLEKRFFDDLVERVDRGVLGVAHNKVDSPPYRFVPLEHLMVSADGINFLEMTSPEDEPTIDYERTEDLDFNQALSCTYQDRANLLVSAGNLIKAREIAEKGLNNYANNRQLNSTIAIIAKQQGDNAGFRKYLGKFEGIGGDDSLFHYSHYLLTGDNTDLDRALEKYPAFAGAIAEKAKTFVKSNPEEARRLFCIASQCFANSSVLDMGGFNRVYGKNIKEINARLKKLVRGL